MTVELLDYRVTKLEENQARFTAATEAIISLGVTIKAMEVGLEKTCKVVDAIELRMQTAEKLVPKDLDDRLRSLEEHAPKTRLIEGMLVTGVMGIISLVCMGAYGMWQDSLRSAPIAPPIELELKRK